MATTTHATFRLSSCDDLWTLAISPTRDPKTPIVGRDGEPLIADVQFAPEPRIVIRPAQPGDVLRSHAHVREGGAK